MITTIGPLVKAAGKRWVGNVSLYVAGSTLGGAVFGTVLGAVGWMMVGSSPLAWRLAFLGAAAAAAAAHEVGIVRLPLPGNNNSVPQRWWRELGDCRASFTYGAVLGIGVTTVIPFAGFYVLLLMVLLIAEPLLGTVLLGGYGLFRSVPVLLASAAIRWGREPRELAMVPWRNAFALRTTNGATLLLFLLAVAEVLR